jgi:serine/threonine-protein kinase
MLSMPEADARSTLVAAGFEVHTVRREYHSTVADGAVISWAPTERAREGSVIELVVSVGARQVDIPEVQGMSLAEAESALQGQGLVPKDREVHGALEAGQVLRTDPPAGTTVDSGSEVRVDVSLGPEPVEVPNVVGRPESEAITMLRDAGLTPIFEPQVHHDEVPAGDVISQDPAPGPGAFRGDEVTLVVSRGPAPVPMPNVRGKTEANATNELEGLGLVVTASVVGRGRSEVIDQIPAPGVEVRRGDEVTILVTRP